MNEEEILERYANHIAALEKKLSEHTAVCKPEKVENLSFWFRVSAWAFGAIWFIMTGAGMYLWNRVDNLTELVVQRGERIAVVEGDVKQLRSEVNVIIQNQGTVLARIQDIREMLWQHEVDQQKQRGR